MSTRLLMDMQSLDQENKPLTSAVRDFAGGGSTSGISEDLGGSLVAEAAVLASMSVISLLGIPLCPGTHRRVVGR